MGEEEGKCPKCDAIQHSISLTCPVCGAHLGYPNVRLATNQSERDALYERFDAAKQRLVDNSLETELQDLLSVVESHGCVVVSMPINVALNLVTDPKNQYVGYEKLVGSGVRAAAEFADDKHRKIVAGELFGSEGENVIYGTLSLSHRGAKTYGDMYCKLRKVAVDDRTSFIEMKSYDFIDKYKDDLPLGYKSNWEDSPKLAVIKLEGNDQIKSNYSFDEWESSLLVCDGKNQENDEFIEAHIYGKFNVESIEHMEIAEPIGKGDKKMAEAVILGFKGSK